MDFGCIKNGYCSDMTRTVAVGQPSGRDAPGLRHRAGQAQLAPALPPPGPASPAQAVDGAARRVIEDAGYGEYFGHSFGHSLGVEIHESPQRLPMRTTSPCPRAP
jgi:Xaa-Pro aminopeptidase